MKKSDKELKDEFEKQFGNQFKVVDVNGKNIDDCEKGGK